MAGNSIASASVLISANADELRSGLGAAGKDVQKWGKDIGKKAGANASGGMGGMVGMLGKAGPYGIAAAAAIGGVAIGLKEVSETIDDIRKQGDIANAMGLTAEQFTGMAGVAKSVGEDTREFTESLVTMGKLGEDAAAGTEEASKAMRLMGIDAKAFTALNTEDQFYKIFDSLNKMEGGSQRTRAAMAAFGEDGGKWLLPLVGKSAEDLKKMAAGFAITTDEMKKATDASAALKTIENRLGGMWRSAAIGLAPLVEAIANFADSAITAVKPFYDWMSRGWHAITEVAIPFFEMVGDAASGLWTEMKTGFAEAFAWVGDLPTIREVVIGVIRGIGTGFAILWDTIKSGAGVVAMVAGTIARAFAAIMKEIPGLEGAGARLEGAGNSISDWGKRQMEGWGESAVSFNKWLDKVIEPKAAKAVDAIKPPAGEKPLTSDPVKLAGVFAKGSAEAYSLVLKNRFGMNDDTAKKHLKETEKVKKGVDANVKATDGVAAAIKALGTF